VKYCYDMARQGGMLILTVTHQGSTRGQGQILMSENA